MTAPLLPPIARPIENALTGEALTLRSLDDTLAFSPAQVEDIVAICNQPLIYQMLFVERMGGQPYGLADALGLLGWANAGWRDGTHFVFVVLSQAGAVLAALDLKSPDLAAGEIGYWASAAHPGIMTNAVRELIAIARSAGYRELFALIRPDNPRSQAVVRRAGFDPAGQIERSGKTYLRFSLTP